MSLHHIPTIDDLLADSLIQKVMGADRVEPQALKALLAGAAARIAAGREARASRRAGVGFANAPGDRRNPLRRPDTLAGGRAAPGRFRGGRWSAVCC